MHQHRPISTDPSLSLQQSTSVQKHQPMPSIRSLFSALSEDKAYHHVGIVYHLRARGEATGMAQQNSTSVMSFAKPYYYFVFSFLYTSCILLLLLLYPLSRRDCVVYRNEREREREIRMACEVREDGRRGGPPSSQCIIACLQHKRTSHTQQHKRVHTCFSFQLPCANIKNTWLCCSCFHIFSCSPTTPGHGFSSSSSLCAFSLQSSNSLCRAPELHGPWLVPFLGGVGVYGALRIDRRGDLVGNQAQWSDI